MGVATPAPKETGGRIMPHSVEAEVAVLGSVLLNPTEAMDHCAELLTPDHFYQRRHQIIFSALLEIHAKSEPIESVTLITRLKDTGKLEEVGGAYYLSTLSNAFPTAAHVGFYIEILRKKFHLRRLIEEASRALEEAFESQDEVEGLMDRVETNILKICDDNLGKENISIKEITERIVKKVNDIQENRGKLPGLSWGFRDLNKLTLGLRSAEMIVLAARPGVGKTALALNVAERLVLDEKIPVGIFSLEMTAEQLALRMACSKANISLWDLYHGGVSENDLRKFSMAAGQIGNSPLHIIAASQLSIPQLRASARRMKKRDDIKILIIDYMQLMVNPGQNRNDNREREVAAISAGIKGLAKDLDIPVLALCQVNRSSEKDDRRGGKPRLSDLRESGAIEQDADIVCLLTHEKANAEEEGEAKDGVLDQPITAEIMVAKNRNGPVGEIKLTFLRKYTRFEDFSGIERP